MTLLFVYNADSGFFNVVKDAMHKVVNPATYDCNLCQLTYGAATMKSQWKTFIASLDANVEFLHKDEFLEQFPDKSGMKFPAGFIQEESKIRLILSAEQMNKANSLDELIELVKTTLNTAHNTTKRS